MHLSTQLIPWDAFIWKISVASSLLTGGGGGWGVGESSIF